MRVEHLRFRLWHNAQHGLGGLCMRAGADRQRGGAETEPAPTDHGCFASCMARQMRSDVAGISMCVTPSGASASSTAAMIAWGDAIAPAWPEPFTPSGLAFVGTPVSVMSNSGRSWARANV